MKLTFTGKRIRGSALALPEGWPARDHDEPDEDVAKAKVSSGAYRLTEPPKRETTTDDSED